MTCLTPTSPPAYRVPWHVDRTDVRHPRLTNAGPEPLDGVRVLLAPASRVVAQETWGVVLPEETRELCLCDLDPADALVAVTWYRLGEDDAYLWRFSL